MDGMKSMVGLGPSKDNEKEIKELTLEVNKMQADDKYYEGKKRELQMNIFKDLAVIQDEVGDMNTSFDSKYQLMRKKVNMIYFDDMDDGDPLNLGPDVQRFI